MAYGIISIATYVIFLTWVVGSQETTGSRVEYKPFGDGAVELTAGMGQAFAFHTGFETKQKHKSQKIGIDCLCHRRDSLHLYSFYGLIR
jgi:hypothetical protein